MSLLWLFIPGALSAIADLVVVFEYFGWVPRRKGQLFDEDTDKPRRGKLIVIFTLLTASLLLSASGMYLYFRDKKMTMDEWMNYPKTAIRQREFFNESVDIDGKSFDSCIFTNSTLIFHGRAPFDLTNNKFRGQTVLEVRVSDGQSEAAAAGAFMVDQMFLDCAGNAACDVKQNIAFRVKREGE